MALFSALKEKYEANLVFTLDDQMKVVNMFSQKVEKYFKQKDLKIPDNVDEVAIENLSDVNIILLLDSRNICISVV